MVTAFYDDNFQALMNRIKDGLLKERVLKQINKVIANPEIGKPMSYRRKGTREVYVKPFRLSYLFIRQKNKVVFLDLYHKKKQ